MRKARSLALRTQVSGLFSFQFSVFRSNLPYSVFFCQNPDKPVSNR
nr:MAG TPA: hypothetical protein [Caudoviricetes sp.]